MKSELKLIPVAFVSAFFCIFGHLILSKSFSDYYWVEYTAALIPFLLMAISYGSVRYVMKLEKEKSTD